MVHRTPSLDRLIEKVPGVQGGEPVVVGTRTPVWSIVEYWRVHGHDVAKVRCVLPHLSAEQIEAALAYYAANKREIDADIASQKEALEQLPAR